MTDISNREDILDVRDIIERFEELETELTDASEGEGNESVDFDGWLEAAANNVEHTLQDAASEYLELNALLNELAGNGGDHRYHGQWYPVTLVRDSYFEDFARDEAEQLDLIPSDAKWPANCINWEEAARELQTDYTSVEFDGVTYWYRQKTRSWNF